MITPNELKEIMNMTLDASYKGAIMNVLSQVLYKNQCYYKEFLYTICKVNMFTL